jgi:GTP-binding protein
MQAYLKERSRVGLLADVLLLVDASLPPRDMDLAGTQWLLSRKMPVTLVYTKCDKAKRGEPAPADNIASFRRELESARLLQPGQFPTCAVGSSRWGRQELLQHIARRVAAHRAAALQPAVPGS